MKALVLILVYPLSLLPWLITLGLCLVSTLLTPFRERLRSVYRIALSAFKN